MYKHLSIAMLALVMASSALAGSLSDNNNAQFELNHVNPGIANKQQLGRLVIKHTQRLLKCTYDFAKLKGAIGTVNLLNEDGQKCVVPSKSVIDQVYIDVITPGTTSASGTAAINMQTAGDLKAALAAASYTGIVAGIPVGTAATAIKTTADRTVTQTIATGALTAGKWNVLIMYLLSE